MESPSGATCTSGCMNSALGKTGGKTKQSCIVHAHYTSSSHPLTYSTFQNSLTHYISTTISFPGHSLPLASFQGHSQIFLNMYLLSFLPSSLPPFLPSPHTSFSCHKIDVRTCVSDNYTSTVKPTPSHSPSYTHISLLPPPFPLLPPLSIPHTFDWLFFSR